MKKTLAATQDAGLKAVNICYLLTKDLPDYPVGLQVSPEWVEKMREVAATVKEVDE